MVWLTDVRATGDRRRKGPERFSVDELCPTILAKGWAASPLGQLALTSDDGPVPEAPNGLADLPEREPGPRPGRVVSDRPGPGTLPGGPGGRRHRGG